MEIMAKKPRVAYCLYGLSGGAKGKDGKGKDPDIFRLGHKHAYEHLLSRNNMDVFMHTWSIESEEELKSLYKPVKAVFEPQIYFDIPEWIIANRDANAVNYHYSRWYSTKKVLELKKQYEKENGFKYDFVMTTRFDLAWNRGIDFSKLSQKKFYACQNCYMIYRKKKMSALKYWHTRENFPPGTKLGRTYRGYPNKGGKAWGLWDIWFVGNSKVMDNFGTIYDDLEEYCKNERMIDKPMVSHHLLALLWLEKNNWVPKLETILNSTDDCAPVRMWYKRFHAGKHYV